MDKIDPETAAVTALREATAALRVGERVTGPRGKVTEDQKPDLAAELAELLQASVALLRTVDLDPVPASPAGHNLQAVAQHITAAATMARQAQHSRTHDIVPTQRTQTGPIHGRPDD